MDAGAHGIGINIADQIPGFYLLPLRHDRPGGLSDMLFEGDGYYFGLKIAFRERGRTVIFG
jgi:hypothetical protein